MEMENIWWPLKKSKYYQKQQYYVNKYECESGDSNGESYNKYIIEKNKGIFFIFKMLKVFLISYMWPHKESILNKLHNQIAVLFFIKI